MTFLTRPVPEGKLVDFYRRVHPGGVGWRRIAALAPEVRSDSGFGRLFLDWLLGIILVYSILFGVGDLLFGELLSGLAILVIATLAALWIWRDLARAEPGVLG